MKVSSILLLTIFVTFKIQGNFSADASQGIEANAENDELEPMVHRDATETMDRKLRSYDDDYYERKRGRRQRRRRRMRQRKRNMQQRQRDRPKRFRIIRPTTSLPVFVATEALNFVTASVPGTADTEALNFVTASVTEPASPPRPNRPSAESILQQIYGAPQRWTGTSSWSDQEDRKKMMWMEKKGGRYMTRYYNDRMNKKMRPNMMARKMERLRYVMKRMGRGNWGGMGMKRERIKRRKRMPMRLTWSELRQRHRNMEKRKRRRWERRKWRMALRRWRKDKYEPDNSSNTADRMSASGVFSDSPDSLNGQEVSVSPSLSEEN